jgi:RNA polymerase sigma factor (sigma-70 family)
MSVDLNDKEVIKILTKSAYRVAGSYGRTEMAEDFIQEMFIQYHNGRKATVSQLFIDYLRSECGSTRPDKNIRASTYNLKNPGPMTEEAMNVPIEQEQNNDFKELTEKLKGEYRTISILYYQWGFTLKEIGHTLGLSESRISQKFKEIEEKFVRMYAIT